LAWYYFLDYYSRGEDFKRRFSKSYRHSICGEEALYQVFGVRFTGACSKNYDMVDVAGFARRTTEGIE
jgi:hypothetical protein